MEGITVICTNSGTWSSKMSVCVWGGWTQTASLTGPNREMPRCGQEWGPLLTVSSNMESEARILAGGEMANLDMSLDQAIESKEPGGRE